MSKCGSYRKHKGGAIGDGSEAGSGAFALGTAPDSFGGKVIGANVSGGTNSQAAQMSKIPQSITGQGMGFQASTSKFHRKRSTRKQRKQRGGGPAPYPDAVGALLPKDMTGPMQLAESGIAGGSGTAKLDDFLMQTRSAVQQHGGGKKSRKGKKQSRKQSRKGQKKQQQKKQQKRKQQQKSQKKQRGGAHNMQAQHGPAAGPYTLLSGADLQKAGLNPQWFDENQVNPNFGGAITVPGGKLN